MDSKFRLVNRRAWVFLCLLLKSDACAFSKQRVRDLTLPVPPGYTKRPFTKSWQESILASKGFLGKAVRPTLSWPAEVGALSVDGDELARPNLLLGNQK